MAISKIVLNGTTQMDITDTTAQSEDVAQGVYFYGADGVKKEGSMAEGGTSTTSDKVVHFIDYDGTALYDYSKDEWTNVTSLPAVPSHQGLVSQGWNWTKAQIDSYLADYPSGDVFVGVTYTTDTGHTRISIHLDEQYKSPMLGININGSVDIDWGDGSSHTTLTGTSLDTIKWSSAHNYSSDGDYVIKLAISGKAVIGSDGTYGTILRYSNDTNSLNARYLACITSIELGDSIESIGDRAFSNCIRLQSITIPNSVASIGAYAFNYCYSLEGMVVPDDVPSIGDYTFYYCRTFENISIPSSISGTIGNWAFGECSSIKNITIPLGVTNIGLSAFAFCTKLKQIVIPDGVTSIGKAAFNGCNTIKKISFPDSISGVIGDYTFQNCYDLESSITFPNGVTKLGDSVFINCWKLKNVSVPNSVERIGANAFQDCKSLESFVIPPGTKVGAYVFEGCKSLKSVTIPDGHDNIQTYMFQGCTNLENIVLPNSITSVGEAAFMSCHRLKSITIPANVPSLLANVFANCKILKSIHFKPLTPPKITNSTFLNLTVDLIIYVPAESLEAYKTAQYWSSVADKIVGE